MKPLTPTEAYAIELLKAQVSQITPPPLPDDVQWHDVLAELTVHTVQFIPVDAVKKIGLSPQDATEYRRMVLTQAAAWNQYMIAQQEVLDILQQADIPVVVIKGAAAAANYPNPMLRVMGDIDLLVKPEDLDKAAAELLQRGWTYSHPVDHNPRHVGLEKQGQPEVEIHRMFSGKSGTPEQNSRLDQATRDAIDRRQTIDVQGFQVPVLPPQENGLILLAHIRQHLEEGLGFRQTLDWLFFAQAILDDVLWSNGMSELAEDTGLAKIAATSTAVCLRSLGLHSDLTVFPSMDDDAADECTQYIARVGNFGRKETNEMRSAAFYRSKIKSPAAFFNYLYTAGCAHWPYAKGKPFLAPAVCIYQIGHSIRALIKRTTSIAAPSPAVLDDQQRLNRILSLFGK